MIVHSKALAELYRCEVLVLLPIQGIRRFVMRYESLDAQIQFYALSVQRLVTFELLAA